MIMTKQESEKEELDVVEVERMVGDKSVCTKYYYECGDFGGPVAIVDDRGMFDNDKAD